MFFMENIGFISLAAFILFSAKAVEDNLFTEFLDKLDKVKKKAKSRDAPENLFSVTSFSLMAGGSQNETSR